VEDPDHRGHTREQICARLNRYAAVDAPPVRVWSLVACLVFLHFAEDASMA
jgi:hypothetical protein